MIHDLENNFPTIILICENNKFFPSFLISFHFIIEGVFKENLWVTRLINDHLVNNVSDPLLTMSIRVKNTTMMVIFITTSQSINDLEFTKKIQQKI